MKWTHEVYCVIEMTSKELARKTEVERALDHRITQKEAAARLGISERQFRRILRRYRQEGDGGLVSRKRRKPSNRKPNKYRYRVSRGQDGYQPYQASIPAFIGPAFTDPTVQLLKRKLVEDRSLSTV